MRAIQGEDAAHQLALGDRHRNAEGLRFLVESVRLLKSAGVRLLVLIDPKLKDVMPSVRHARRDRGIKIGVVASGSSGCPA